LLFSDVSSLLVRSKDSWENTYLQKFTRELNYFLEKDYDNLMHNQWDFIEGTKIRLTMSDNNPDNEVINHPDYKGESMLWWGERTTQEWNNVFASSFKIIKTINYDFFMELQEMIQKIVPMKTARDVHNSCSYKDCVGTLYLWYTIETQYPEFHIIEALIHESSHNKMNLIVQLQPLHNNNYNQNYYSPYRPDARPMHWVLLWVHALVPAVYVLLQAIEKGIMIDTWWQEKVVLYHIKNKLGLNVINKFLETTEIWSILVDDISIVLKKCDVMIQKLNLLQELDMIEIQRRAKIHFLDVRHKYPKVKY
jgi:hypothetical protein